MKPATTEFLEKARVRNSGLASSRSDGFNGAFFVPSISNPGLVFKVICSDGEGWEHVSVSLPTRCPTWSEMSWIKSLFWDDEEPVMQLHPPKSTYVNNHRFCLHLWKPIGKEIPLPPDWMVGIKDAGELK